MLSKIIYSRDFVQNKAELRKFVRNDAFNVYASQLWGGDKPVWRLSGVRIMLLLVSYPA